MADDGCSVFLKLPGCLPLNSTGAGLGDETECVVDWCLPANWREDFGDDCGVDLLEVKGDDFVDDVGDDFVEERGEGLVDD